MPDRILAWTEANGLYAMSASMIGGTLGYVSHFLGLDALIARLIGAVPAASAFPWGAIIGAIGGLLVVVATGLFKVAILRITHGHERSMKQFEYDHEELRKDELKAKLRHHGIDFEDSADEPSPKHTA